MPSVGFEPAIPAIETYALGPTATRIGLILIMVLIITSSIVSSNTAAVSTAIDYQCYPLCVSCGSSMLSHSTVRCVAHRHLT